MNSRGSHFGQTRTVARPAVIAILGSCISRDNFNSRFNPDYKEFYRCALTQNQASLISLMSEGLTLPEEQYGPLSEHDRWTVRSDLNKEFLRKVVDVRPEYLVVDFFADIHFGCLRLPDGRYITNNRWKLPKTDFYRHLKDRGAVHPFRMKDDPEQYLEVWQEAFGRFSAFVAENLPDTTVVVHRGHYTGQLQLPGQLETVPLLEYRKRQKVDVSRANRQWRRLDRLATAHRGAEVIDLTDRSYATFDDHPWGPFYVHYTMDYYSRFLIELHKIHLRHGAVRDVDLSLRLVDDVEKLAAVAPELEAEQLRRHHERTTGEKMPTNHATRPAAEPRTVRVRRTIRRAIAAVPALDRLFRIYSRFREGTP